MASSTKSSSQPDTTCVPWGLILVPILFNFSINDLDDGKECTLGKFMHRNKLGEMDDAMSRDTIQRDLSRPVTLVS